MLLERPDKNEKINQLAVLFKKSEYDILIYLFSPRGKNGSRIISFLHGNLDFRTICKLNFD